MNFFKRKASYLDELNSEQLEAVKTTEGYVRVIAGAGSGKTKALTSRYIYLTKEMGVSPADILCVTFTNKAAHEMKKRVRQIVGDMDTSLICTFHGFCAHMLREDIHVLNYPNQFMIIDDEDAENILRNIYEQLEITSSHMSFADAKKMISDSKNKTEYVDWLTDKDYSYIQTQYENVELSLDERIFFGYLYEQRKSFALDFDDLIIFALYIFSKRPDILEKWQRKLVYIMVDEFQDVSLRQNHLCELLSSYHKNLFIVGDPDQTIYSWRGAAVDIMLSFNRVHPSCKDIILYKNYRSTSNILNASNELISKNKKRIPKDLIAIKKEEMPVVYNHTKTVKDEADWIANEIIKLKNHGCNYNDIAVLYRAHYVSRSIEQAFIEKNIKYRIYNGVAFFKRREIKDILAYLRMIVFSDDLSFERIINVPKRNFGKKRMELLKEYAETHQVSLYDALKDNLHQELIMTTTASQFVDLIEKYKGIYKDMKVSDIFSRVLDESGYENFLRTEADDDRINNVAELKNTIIEFENQNREDMSLDEYLNTISLYTDMDVSETTDEVKMMTIHTAKGLEFPFVFVCSLNEGIFPSSKVLTTDQLEEERRIAYVAFTRAEKALFLSDAEGLNYNNTFRYPSRFIFNAGKNNLDYLVELDESFYEASLSSIETSEENLLNQEQIFEVGDRVKHESFGEGEIVSIDSQKSTYEIKFDDFETARNIRFSGPIVKISNSSPKDE